MRERDVSHLAKRAAANTKVFVFATPVCARRSLASYSASLPRVRVEVLARLARGVRGARSGGERSSNQNGAVDESHGGLITLGKGRAAQFFFAESCVNSLLARCRVRLAESEEKRSTYLEKRF